MVAARATRLPIYSSFAKEGNLSDLFAKGEAISTLFNVVGIGAGIQLASTVCSSMQGKVELSHPIIYLQFQICLLEKANCSRHKSTEFRYNMLILRKKYMKINGKRGAFYIMN